MIISSEQIDQIVADFKRQLEEQKPDMIQTISELKELNCFGIVDRVAYKSESIEPWQKGSGFFLASHANSFKNDLIDLWFTDENIETVHVENLSDVINQVKERI